MKQKLKVLVLGVGIVLGMGGIFADSASAAGSPTSISGVERVFGGGAEKIETPASTGGQVPITGNNPTVNELFGGGAEKIETPASTGGQVPITGETKKTGAVISTQAPVKTTSSQAPTTRQTNCGSAGTVFCGQGYRAGASFTATRLDNNVSKERNLRKLIVGWTNFLLPIAAILAVTALVWAGFLYITAFGDDGRMGTAKNIIVWTVLGIILILGSYAIVNTVMKAAF